ncbi:MAG: HAD-IB family phosphatase [Aggregatilineales bacterium]
MTRWASFDLIFFDCDSTLSAIEGVDELARLKGKEGRVGLLTQKAMDGDLELSDVYGKRLRAIRPTRGQLAQIEQLYWDRMVADAPEVIGALHALGKQVFIISGGLAAPVRGFGRKLGVPDARIRAVELEFNELSGDWWKYYAPHARAEEAYLDYDDGPLTVSSGKAEIVRSLADGQWGRRLMVGDGMSDLAARSAVDLFVGFGGVARRARVEAEADVYLAAPRLAPILPLAAGPGGYELLKDTPYRAVFEEGLALARESTNFHFRDEAQQSAFYDAFVEK